MPFQILWKVPRGSDPLLSKIQILIGEGIVQCSQTTDRSSIQVKSRPIDEVPGISIVQDWHRIVNSISIMIVKDDFSRNIVGSENWAEGSLDENSLLFGCHVHAWVVFWVQGLVLNCDCVDEDSLLFHCLNVFG